MKFLKYLSILLLISSFLSCASQVVRYETASGQPEISIPTELASKKEVKDLIVRSYQEAGWNLIQDNDYSSKFIRPCGGSFSCVMGQVLLGNSYSTPPNFEIALSWIGMEEKTKVLISDYSLSTQMAFGQINRSSLLGNNKTFNDAINNLRTFLTYFETIETGLYEGGSIGPGKIGFYPGTIKAENRIEMNLEKNIGVYVEAVQLYGNAFDAGIKRGDILLKANSVKLTVDNLSSVLKPFSGELVSIEALSNNQIKIFEVFVQD